MLFKGDFNVVGMKVVEGCLLSFKYSVSFKGDFICCGNESYNSSCMIQCNIYLDLLNLGLFITFYLYFPKLSFRVAFTMKTRQ